MSVYMKSHYPNTAQPIMYNWAATTKLHRWRGMHRFEEPSHIAIKDSSRGKIDAHSICRGSKTVSGV
ncbi:hypothetical protein TNCV_2793041 [Trichonephila clavipes]|nr:hypothetical protein TNCV_2793041 [Trichonephila clavipes]